MGNCIKPRNQCSNRHSMYDATSSYYGSGLKPNQSYQQKQHYYGGVEGRPSITFKNINFEFIILYDININNLNKQDLDIQFMV